MARIQIPAIFLIVYLLSNLSAFAEKGIGATPLEEINFELSQNSNGLISKKIRNWIRKKTVLSSEEESCKIFPKSEYETVLYFGLTCSKNQEPQLLSFYSQKKSNLAVGQFRIKEYHRIGKKKYLEIEVGNSFGSSLVGNNPKPNLDSSRIPHKSVSNPNLYYIQTVANNPKRRNEVASNLEVFFDLSCPLEFIEKDESFYWDRTVVYVFRITCIKDTLYSLLRVPGNESGDLLVSNTNFQSIQKGDRFLAKATLRKITEKQMYWENYTLFYE